MLIKRNIQLLLYANIRILEAKTSLRMIVTQHHHYIYKKTKHITKQFAIFYNSASDSGIRKSTTTLHCKRDYKIYRKTTPRQNRKEH